MIPSFLELPNQVRSLNSKGLLDNIPISSMDFIVPWRYTQNKRFRLSPLFFISPDEHEPEEEYITAQEEDDDQRDYILNSLSWFDSESFETMIYDDLEEEEDWFGSEDNPVGYHNLNASQLDWDLLDQFDDRLKEMVVFKQRFDRGLKLDKSFFSLDAGSIFDLDSGSVNDCFEEEFEMMTESSLPEDAANEDEFFAADLEEEETDVWDKSGDDVFDLWLDYDFELTHYYENPAFFYWVSLKSNVNLLPLDQLIAGGLNTRFFRRASFLKNNFIGFDGLFFKKDIASIGTGFVVQPYDVHLSQPRVFFRNWSIHTHFEDDEDDLLNNIYFSKYRLKYKKRDKRIKFLRSPYLQLGLTLKKEALPKKLGGDSRWFVRKWFSRRFIKTKPKLRRSPQHKRSVLRWLRRNRYFNDEVEDLDEDDLFEQQRYKMRHTIQHVNNDVFDVEEPKDLVPFMQRRNRYRLFGYWRSLYADKKRVPYASLTGIKAQGLLFRKKRWRFRYQFNNYFVQKTLAWYMDYYILPTFFSNLEFTDDVYSLFHEKAYYLTWREGAFKEDSISEFFRSFVEYHSKVAEYMRSVIHKHPFHIVTPSPWPFFTAFGALLLTTGGVLYMHGYILGLISLLLGLIYLVCTVTLWWRDVIREASFLGNHTSAVQTNLKIGFALFIVSEVMFFFAFFWAFFHSSLSPAVDIGAIWPPLGISPISPYGIPLFNSFVLALSGYTVTYAHHAIIEGDRALVSTGLIFTLFLAFLFSTLQFIEYRTLPFLLSDGIYGSTFYMTTGFHALHVIIGSTFLLVCLFRITQFTKKHHVGFEAAIWYWHFVDVVWLFLWLSIYWWPSL